MLNIYTFPNKFQERKNRGKINEQRSMRKINELESYFLLPFQRKKIEYWTAFYFFFKQDENE